MPLDDLAQETYNLLCEQADLYERANDLICSAMQDGVLKGHKGKWLEQSFDTHLEHAIIHLLKLKIGDVSEQHLSHACCRLAMASFVLNENGNGNGDDKRGEEWPKMDGERTKSVSSDEQYDNGGKGEQEEGTVDWNERFRREGWLNMSNMSPSIWLGDNS